MFCASNACPFKSQDKLEVEFSLLNYELEQMTQAGSKTYYKKKSGATKIIFASTELESERLTKRTVQLSQFLQAPYHGIDQAIILKSAQKCRRLILFLNSADLPWL